ncbi:MAG: dipeptidase [Candidatus Izimaplasma sp.]|nr:dipeptidase [Candidatus Izimaplasma bacterium]
MIFDAHGDILTDMFFELKEGNEIPFESRHLENYQAGNVTHSIFVNWTDPLSKDPSSFINLFDTVLPHLTKRDDIFDVCLTYNDLITTDPNKIGVIVGIEGLKFLESPQQIQDLYNRGVRHASLTWNETNKYAGGLSGDKGLTLLGKDLIHKMEQLGMIIDLAHLNPRSFDDVLYEVSGPVIISHGNTKHIENHKRNYTDYQLLSLKKTGGVIGICGIPSFVATDSSKQTVKQMVKHIDYAVKLIGIDHVGLGFDFCYYLENNPKNNLDGLASMKDTDNIIAELDALGYTKEDIEKIQYKNFFRVFENILK